LSNHRNGGKGDAQEDAGDIRRCSDCHFIGMWDKREQDMVLGAWLDTNNSQYSYSAWAPQFANKLQLSATQSNIIV
jgi:hypothetical protein